jgi:predicted methyltransferase
LTPVRFAAAAATLALFAGPLAAQAAPAAITAAIADAGRPAADVAKDASRKPADIIEFARVKPGKTVIDIWPGGGYWTRLFSGVVGPKGKVYSYVPAEIAVFKNDPVGIIKKLAAEPGRGNVEEVSDPLASAPPPQMENTVDVAFTFENYHDTHDSFMKGASVDGFNTAMFKLLKHGGYYVIVDHAALAGTGLSHTEDLHRIDPAAVKAEVEKAGFVFDGESKVLANPDDPRTGPIFGDAIRGKTDRFAYRFRKP